ncbi:MAG: hypothetical protein OXJ52_04810 [Oligoflexia bacterium]|nr:hypothetical protein [Oligoflexia bacterium]
MLIRFEILSWLVLSFHRRQDSRKTCPQESLPSRKRGQESNSK